MANQFKLWVNKRTLGAVGVVLLLALALLVVKGLSGGTTTSAAGTTTSSRSSSTSSTAKAGTTASTARSTTSQAVGTSSTLSPATAATAAPTTAAAAAQVTAPPGVGTIARSSLPKQAITTLGLIDKGGPYPYRQDGVVWENREGRLPDRPQGYYHEYTVVTPGSPDRGARRIVTGGPGERYYTDDHYGSFRLIVAG